MTVLRRLVALGALLFVVAPALVAQSNAPRDPRVDAIVQAVIKSNEPGGSIVVIRDGKVVHVAGYGLADLDSRKPNLPGTRYHMASTGKQFTALSRSHRRSVIMTSIGHRDRPDRRRRS